MHLLSHLILFAQAVPAQSPDPISATTLLYAIGTALLAIGGLIAWALKAALPKVLDNHSKQTEALVQTVQVVPTAINGLKEAMILSNNGLKETIELAKDQIIEEVRDEKLKQLSDQLKK